MDTQHTPPRENDSFEDHHLADTHEFDGRSSQIHRDDRRPMKRVVQSTQRRREAKLTQTATSPEGGVLDGQKLRAVTHTEVRQSRAVVTEEFWNAPHVRGQDY
jgi:hypothetical protein